MLPLPASLIGIGSACRLAGHSGEAIADAVIETLARSPEVADSESEHGHAWIASEKSMSTWVVEMFGHYEAALVRRGHGPG